MSGELSSHIRELFSSRSSVLEEACSVRGAGDRVDALTLVCRDALRASGICYIDGVLHFFNGRYYESCSREDVLVALVNVLVDCGVSPTDVRRMSDMPLSVLSERSFPRQNLLAFDNGVLALDSLGWIDGFDGSLLVSESLPYGYDPSAGCQVWDAFLSEMIPDRQTRLVLQEFFGMCYLDRARYSVEKFALFVGKGANGKSVIFEVMKRVLGKENVSTLDAAQLTDEKMLPYLKGRRLNFSPDMARSKDFSSALKALASGQDVTARGIFRDAETVKAPPLCFAMNEMPVFRDVTDAFFRRVLLFRFEVQVPAERQDRQLVDRICRTDLPGIFNWVMEGTRRLMKNGGRFSGSGKMDADLGLLRSEVSQSSFPVKAFLEGRGYSLRPVYGGQPFTLVSQNEIDLGLRGAVSRYMITSELKRFGVQTFRSKELFYKVYQRER